MMQILTNTKDIKKSNAVFVLEKKEDIDTLSFLKLDSKITKKISSALREKKEQSLQFFLGTTKFENLYVYIITDNTEKSITFLGKEFPKLPLDHTVFIYSESDIGLVVDTVILSRYKFQDLKSEKKKSKLSIICPEGIQESVQDRISTIENIILARDLGETPSNLLTPEVFAKKVKSHKWKNTKIKILSPKDIEKKGLGLIHAVGKGSENKPYMVIMERIVDKKLSTYGFIGKGITFDTGGNQIKPGDFMYDMKGDMGGAAVTFAMMKELDRKNVNVNIVACLCLAENTVSGNAYKPSDIITGYTGKTVEVIHTDAEGRLVLADGISYVSKNYKTQKMCTIATLTGAVIVALGFRYAGIMGNDEEFIEGVLQQSKDHTEKYVRLPFDDFLISKTKSEIADYKNLDRSVHAGSSMGGAFLSNFVENNEDYTHIDIAGAYLNESEAYGKVNKGMTGFGVDSLSKIFTSL